MTRAIRKTTLPYLSPPRRGKVRDTYDFGLLTLLMVATDRISAFDVVLPTAIPGKGIVLNKLSAFWFEATKHLVPNHFIGLAEDTVWGAGFEPPAEAAKRAMLIKRAERIDIECVVRGYITGSAWTEYQRKGTVAGNKMPAGMLQGEKFPEPLFTPTTKAEVGHDESLTYEQVEAMVGEDRARELEEISIAVYKFAHDLALERGIIIADTKMEFGWIHGTLTLIDELFTPDSSRFWDAGRYKPGKPQPSFDKQIVRDWLNKQEWNHEPPAPKLSRHVVKETQRLYLEVYKRLTEKELVV